MHTLLHRGRREHGGRRWAVRAALNFFWYFSFFKKRKVQAKNIKWINKKRLLNYYEKMH